MPFNHYVSLGNSGLRVSPFCWTPLIALQLEFSLLERTIEGELIPAGFGYSGATVNGFVAPLNPLSPASDAERY